MQNIEKITTTKNIELFKQTPEWEKRQERESKLTPIYPSQLEYLARDGVPIEQIYLSHPNDEFSLRLRAKATPIGTEYTAALKDRGEVSNGYLSRLEIETPINQTAYEYYAANPSYPRLKKRRARIGEHTTVDFIDGFDDPVVEVESPDDISELPDIGYIDHTGDKALLAENIAHRLTYGENGWYPERSETVSEVATKIADEFAVYYRAGLPFVAIGLSGMSGSGKSTVAKAAQELMRERYGEEFEPVIISTDDYHRGHKWLEATYGAPWTNWDDPRVYNTAQMAEDLKLFAAGEPLLRQHFDFISEEVVVDEIIQPKPFVLIEGLFADSRDLRDVRCAHFDMPVSPATSIGRDLRRLVIEGRANGVFGSPEERLRYQLETALPTFIETREHPRNRLFRGWIDTSRLIARQTEGGGA